MFPREFPEPADICQGPRDTDSELQRHSLSVGGCKCACTEDFNILAGLRCTSFIWQLGKGVVLNRSPFLCVIN
jgi:hypothetical protein